MKRYETIVGEEIYKFSDLIFRPLNNSIEESLIINKTFECANVAIEMAFSISAETKKLGETLEDQFGIVFRYSKTVGEDY